MIVTITPAQRDLAQLAVDLAERMGEEPDPRMVVLANDPGPHARNGSSRSDDAAVSTTPPEAAPAS